MRLFVAALILIPSLALADTNDVRYQLHHGENTWVMVDGKTGKSWVMQKNGEILGFAPIFYAVGDYKYSIYPSTYSVPTFTVSPAPH